MANKNLYRISFYNHEQVYEVYARSIAESEIFGFIEIEQLAFGENTTVVVDPSEERLKSEFEAVTRCYVPVGSIIRIDMVDKQGVATIKESSGNKNNVSVFPGMHLKESDKK